MRVIRSAGQNVSPSDDGRLFDQAFTDGLFEDATIVANGGNTLSLSALYGIICGRDFTAEAQTISAVLPQTDAATGYVYVEFDTSSDDIITIGTVLAPFTPTYENINTNGAVVQMVIAEYTASAVAVTSVTPTYVKASSGGVGSLAMIEASPATANHAVGTYLVYNGILYSVTSAIAVGETLVVGTNISEAKVGDALSELKSGLNTMEGSLSEYERCYPISSGEAITSSNSRRLSFSGIVVGLLYVVGSSTARCGLYILYGGTSTIIVEPIKAATACTITTGTGYFDITSTSGSIYGFILTRNTFNRITERTI